MQKINNIEIKNFKSISHQKIEGCKRINVFVGPPNVGKSNILEALSNFSISGDSEFFSDFVRLGKPTTLFFNGNVDDVSETILNDFYRVRISYQAYGLSVSFELDRFNRSFPQVDKEIIEADINFISDAKEKIFRIGGFEVNQKSLEVKNFQGDGSLRSYLNSIPDFASTSDYKRSPILKYKFKEDIDYDSKEAWKLKHPYGQNIFEIISTKPLLNEEIINLFKIYDLSFLYDSGSQEYKILRIVGNKIFTIPYSMIADTLQRLIFYKTAIQTNSNSVLLFEEPEANCYEPYILEITNAIKNDKNDNQFFIVTHSQYVIEELLRDEESRNNTNIYLVGLDNNETRIKLLSPEVSKEVYQTGLNIFFNYQSLWDEN